MCQLFHLFHVTYCKFKLLCVNVNEHLYAQVTDFYVAGMTRDTVVVYGMMKSLIWENTGY